MLYSTQAASAANTANICDLSDGAAIYPVQERHSIYVGTNQELTAGLEVDPRGFYYTGGSIFQQGPLGGNVNLGPSFLSSFGFISSPFNQNLTGNFLETKTVNFAVGPDDLYLEYEIADTLIGDELALTGTVSNLLDEDPPIFLGGNIVPAQRGFVNGNTIGRLVQVGIRTRF